MALDTSGLSGDALKRAEAYNRAMTRAEKAMKAQQKLAEQIGGSLLGIDGSEFFRSLTDDEINNKMGELRDIISDLNDKAKAGGEQLNQTFQQMGEASGLVGKSSEEIALRLNVSNEAAKQLKEAFDGTNEAGAGIAEMLQEMGDSAEDLVKTIVEDGNFEETLVQQFKDTYDELQEIDTELAVTQDRMGNINEQVFSLRKGFAAVGQNLTKDFNLQGLISGLMEFDSIIKQAQIDSGINFSQNTYQMSQLTSETARFGMSVQDTTDMMTDLGHELRTSNFEIIAEATEDLAAMQKATGLASGDIAKMTKEFVMFGRSAKEVADYSAEVMAEAQMFGLNGREIMQDIADNMANMRRMGFVGGEQSLKRMVMEAKRLGMEVDEIFNVAKRARSIEGAMEMAAELQLAGGSFAQIDPMQLLSAARKGPEELQNILGQMGSDIGRWNEETGQYEFDPVDADRLQMVADATGYELDSLQNMIAKNAEDNKKMNLLPPSLFGADLTEEEKMFLMNATKIGEGGALELSADIDGVSDISQLTQEQIQAAMEKAAADEAFLEDQAAQNMSFQETKDALMASITNLFSAFQPLLQMLTDMINEINKMGPTAKMIIGGLVIGLKLFFGPAKAFMQGVMMRKGFDSAGAGKGVLGGLKGMLGRGRGGGTGSIAKDGAPPETPKGKSPGGWIGSMAEGLKRFGKVKWSDILKFGAAMAVIGTSVVLFMAGLAATGSPDGAQLAAAAASIVILAGGLWLSSKILGKMSMKDVMIGALAMGIMGLALIPFAYAAQMMTEVDWLSVLAGVGIALLAILALTALGAIMLSPLGLFFIIGVGVLLLAAIALLAAGLALQLGLEPLTQIGEIDWAPVIEAGWSISLLGWALLAGAFPLMLGAMALAVATPFLMVASLGLMTFGLAAQTVSGIDWAAFSQMGSALMSVIPGLLAFAFAGLLMFNPLMLFGMTMMFTALSQLGGIMTTLGPNLEQGASGIERMAEGVGRLEAAVARMDMEKLSKLRGLASAIAMGGANIGKFADSMRGAAGGGGGGGGGTTRHVVELRLDGKKLKEIELRDNKYST